MVWNPLRLLRTLVHFEVAGPLSRGLNALPGLSNAAIGATVTESFDAVSMIPFLPLPTVSVWGGSPAQVAALASVLEPLDHKVGALSPQGSALVNTPLVVWLPGAAPGDSLTQALGQLRAWPAHQEATLVDFCQPATELPQRAIAALWGSLDDGVMGGVSASQVQWQEGLRFVGQVSTANNGGFASVRTRNIEPPLNLSQWQGTVLYAQGDGQRYKWILRDNPGWDSLAYCRSFDTDADRPSLVRTPFREMVATRRARTVPDASPLNPTQLYSMQLMLSKFEYDGELNPAFRAGAFGLTVQRLGVYRQGPKPVMVLPKGTAELGPPLAAAGLTGVILQGENVAVIGADTNLPPEVTPAAINAIFEALSG